MRLNLSVVLILLFSIWLLSIPSMVFAVTCIGTTYGSCSGPCGVQEVTYSNTVNQTNYVTGCTAPECVIVRCTDSDNSCNGNTYDPSDDVYSTPWCPVGFPNTTCTK